MLSCSLTPVVTRRTGAEKPRSRLGTGRCGRPEKTKRPDAEARRSTAVVPDALMRPSPCDSCSGRSRPSAPSSPTAMGMTSGAFSLWPGVAAVLCSQSSVIVPAAVSCVTLMRSCGVPAWLYQRPKSDRSTPLASAMAARKSSHVTAQPSWRLKYKSIPARKPSRPNSVSYMRTTSAPFSYTVVV